MRYKLLGKSGLRVAELALGTMTFGEDWGFGASKEESRKMFDAYVEAGGNFIDTANNYNNGTSEKFVGDFVSANRDWFVIATKYTMNFVEGDMNYSGNQRKNMVRTLEDSLQRLNTDYIDLYWVHARDYVTPIEEVMRALDDMVQAGKILYIGISDTPAWVVAQANTLAELRGWTQFVGLQIRYSLIERSAERELLPMARQFDMAVTPFQVLAEGVLAGKYNKRTETETGRIADSDLARDKRALSIADQVTRVAQEIGCTPSQVALSWVRKQPGVIIPIIGARNLAQMEDNLGCLTVTLTEEQMQRLDEASKINLGFPHDFLGSDNIKGELFGHRFADLERHRGENW